MAILKHVEPNGEHTCEPPKNPEKEYGRGAVWECDGCGKQYVLGVNMYYRFEWFLMLKAAYLPSQRENNVEEKKEGEVKMTDQELETLAVEFLDFWKSFQNEYEGRSPFHHRPQVKKLIDLGFIASHVNPREGEYALEHEYTGTAFFTGHGELVFTEVGLSFAKRCAEILCQREGGGMKVIKVVAIYPR